MKRNYNYTIQSSGQNMHFAIYHIHVYIYIHCVLLCMHIYIYIVQVYFVLKLIEFYLL